MTRPALRRIAVCLAFVFLPLTAFSILLDAVKNGMTARDYAGALLTFGMAAAVVVLFGLALYPYAHREPTHRTAEGDGPESS